MSGCATAPGWGAAPGAATVRESPVAGLNWVRDGSEALMRMRRVMIPALLLCAGLSGAASAGSISISPASPSSTDSITATVRGGFYNRCWNNPSQASCSMIQPDTLLIQVSVNYCGGSPSCVCADMPFDYARACKAAPLAPGTYVARFVELHVNPADPLPSATTTVQFTVSESTPTLRRSWGVLKSMYR
jgi:hypothetical protein